MRCPFCGEESRVLDSRTVEDGRAVRRRRECCGCGRRFTTYEKVDGVPIVVVKRDGRREVFNRDKILGGIIKACEKRPIPLQVMEKVVDEIEKDLQNAMVAEVDSVRIGEMVLEKLREIDEVAYVRFASVYRQFEDVSGFVRELDRLQRMRKTQGEEAKN
ncbi:MAG: transcriptional repressor NrdR [Eubacteriales bacterium]|nr:transcriptional repressor NrdR [Eubacteriales bacterium]MDN5364135.1 transcriptional repressor NrdR [Eubacteriales bacterium]